MKPADKSIGARTITILPAFSRLKILDTVVPSAVSNMKEKTIAVKLSVELPPSKNMSRMTMISRPIETNEKINNMKFNSHFPENKKVRLSTSTLTVLVTVADV